jgi:transcriptional regulator with XRE-family HTH domain
MTDRSPRHAGAIDVRIGKRLRDARRAQHMSQTKLAAALGVRFQQLQKYESGKNRISAGRLYEAAHALGLPITFFFEGITLSQSDRKTRILKKRAPEAFPPRQ